MIEQPSAGSLPHDFFLFNKLREKLKTVQGSESISSMAPQAFSSIEVHSRNHEKPSCEHTDLVRTKTVEPLPKNLKTEGGLLLDAEEYTGPTSLQLAADGHVCIDFSGILSHSMVMLTKRSW